MERLIPPDDFGLTLFVLRTSQGYEQEEVARLAGMSQATVSLLERGKYKKRQSFADLDRICSSLRISRTTGRRTLAFIASLRAGAEAAQPPFWRRRLGAFSCRAYDHALDLTQAAEAVLVAGLRGAGGEGAAARREDVELVVKLWARLPSDN